MHAEKVVTAEEMARIEKLAYADGASPSLFMEKAGSVIAEYIEDYFLKFALEKHVTVLAGKGNNGGDAYVASIELQKRGFSVKAWQVFPLSECSALCRKYCAEFQAKGGSVSFLRGEKKISFEKTGVILDGLVGTGFKGKAEGALALAINSANEASLPILAIDIPSGLNGNTGEVGSVAIRAEETIYLGLPKLGFFIDAGWNHVGRLVRADFGLETAYIEKAKASAFLFIASSAASLLPPIRRTRHKYEAGYLLGVAGSSGLCGAALLASFSALRSGCGIVRLFHPLGVEAEMGRAALEVVKEGFDFSKPKRIFEEAKRAKAAFVGPGLGRTKKVETFLKGLFSKLALPTVVDADALYLLAQNPRWKLSFPAILTPHHKEMERLLGKSEPDPIPLLAACQNYVNRCKVILVLKGAPTFIFQEKKLPLIIPRGDPGMATAGSGDVLTGIISALLAQGLKPFEAATLGVYLHALAGEAAAFEKTSYSMVASDITECLPEAFKNIIINF